MAPHSSEKSLLSPRAGADLCTVVGQSSAIVGGKLYYAMGTYTFSDGQILVRQPKLFSISLQNSFPAHSLISGGLYEEIDLPGPMPDNSDFGILMHTNTTLYFYDPESDSNNGTKIWTFNAETSTFAEVTVGGEENVPYQPYPGGYASDPATGMMYYSGTYLNSQKNKKRKREEYPEITPRDGDISLEKRAPSSPWLQVLDASRGDDNVRWLEGAGKGATLLYATMQYVRYGKKGVLIAFGGVNPFDDSQFQDPDVAAYRNMRDIFVFDIDSSKWYTVQSRGQVPDGRLNFCSGLSAAPDDTTFQITIYGGYKLSNQAATNKVHVLVLPAFEWIDVTPSDDLLGDGHNWGRQTPKCMMWNDAQMIVLGGTIQGNSASFNPVVNTDSCNSTHPPLLILDTTTFEWLEEFNPNKSYSQPRAIYDVVGGDWRGLSSITEPDGGFNSTTLKSIFATTVRRINQPTAFAVENPTDPSSTSPPNNDTGSGVSGSSTNVGAIVGGVVGGIGVLVLALVVIFLCRRRKRNVPSIPPGESTSYNKPELQGSTPRESGAAARRESRDVRKSELHGDSLPPGLYRDASAPPVELPASVVGETAPGGYGQVHEMEGNESQERHNVNKEGKRYFGTLSDIPVPPPPGRTG